MTAPRSLISWISSWLGSRWILLLISLGLAIMVWALVNSGQVIKESRYLKLQYSQLPSNLVFHRMPLSEIRLELLGPLREIRSIQSDELFYAVDLSGAKPGVHRVEIDPDLVRRPFDVEIVSISPRSFNVNLEEKTVRSVPVSVSFVGSPADGYSLRRFQAHPDRLNVRGPLSTLNRLKELPMEISLAHREGSFVETQTPRVDISDIEIEGNVSVQVEIASNRVQRQVNAVTVVAQGSSHRVTIHPDKAKVSIEGNDADMANLGAQLKVKVQTEGLSRGRYRLRGHVDLPSTLKLLSIEPSTFRVEIQ